MFLSCSILGLVVVGLFICWGICRVVYNLHFHPFAKVPGPKLAAATQWYEFYYDIFKWPGGQYSWQIDKMHESYGPIVRVTPHQVHIKDPSFYNRLYCNASEGLRDKYAPSAHMAGSPLAGFGTVHHDAHRHRRSAVSTFYSKRAINDLEPWIHERCTTLCSNFLAQQAKHGKVELRVNFTAFATEMIVAHALHGTRVHQDLRVLQDEEVALEWQETVIAIELLTPLVKQATWLLPLALKLPLWLTRGYAPLRRVLLQTRVMYESACKAIRDESALAAKEKLGDKSTTAQSHNIFRSILRSEEKGPDRLAQEGFVAIQAGSSTVGRTLSDAIYYILSHQEKTMSPLIRELRSVMPDRNTTPTLKQLEQLPYLTGVIKETLRISALFTSRMPLVAPAQTLKYGEHVIPPGYPVSMSLRHILLDEQLFRQPLEFLPERWLKSDPDVELAERWFVPFNRGTRNCVGINLAYAELYIVLATVLRRFELQLHDVVWERDIRHDRDCFIGEPKTESKGVHVTVKARED